MDHSLYKVNRVVLWHFSHTLWKVHMDNLTYINIFQMWIPDLYDIPTYFILDTNLLYTLDNTKFSTFLFLVNGTIVVLLKCCQSSARGRWKYSSHPTSWKYYDIISIDLYLVSKRLNDWMSFTSNNRFIHLEDIVL